MIALLGLGATSGGVALGMIPQPFTASAPAPTPSPSEPVAPSTPESAPVQETPDPVPIPTTPSLPHTAGGSGRGATLTAIRSEYPDVHPEDPAASGPWSLWQTSSSGGTITFEIGADAETVVGIKIGDPSQLPPNVCD